VSSDRDEIFDGHLYETTGTALDLTAQTDFIPGFNTQWYWAVLPVYEGNLTPDPDSPDFETWNFTTAAGPVSEPDVITAEGVVSLTWVASSGATAYKIYAADEPNSPTWNYIAWTASTQLAIPIGTERVRFYRVTAISGETPPEP
jgi:hypothetical protein